LANTDNAPRRSARRSGGFLSFLFLVAVVVCFFYVGRWLVAEDPLEHAQAIAVLSGRMPIRVLEAATLYRAGYAPEIWLTHSIEPGKSLEAEGVEYKGEEHYNQQLLIHEGVAPAAITSWSLPSSAPPMTS
jgi:hypothetical protein